VQGRHQPPQSRIRFQIRQSPSSTPTPHQAVQGDDHRAATGFNPNATPRRQRVHELRTIAPFHEPPHPSTISFLYDDRHNDEKEPVSGCGEDAVSHRKAASGHQHKVVVATCILYHRWRWTSDDGEKREQRWLAILRWQRLR